MSDKLIIELGQENDIRILEGKNFLGFIQSIELKASVEQTVVIKTATVIDPDLAGLNEESKKIAKDSVDALQRHGFIVRLINFSDPVEPINDETPETSKAT